MTRGFRRKLNRYVTYALNLAVNPAVTTCLRPGLNSALKAGLTRLFSAHLSRTLIPNVIPVVIRGFTSGLTARFRPQLRSGLTGEMSAHTLKAARLLTQEQGGPKAAL